MSAPRLSVEVLPGLELVVTWLPKGQVAFALWWWRGWPTYAAAMGRA